MTTLEKHVAHFWKLADASARFKKPVMVEFNRLGAVDKTSGYITERAFSIISIIVNRAAYRSMRRSNPAMMGRGRKG